MARIAGVDLPRDKRIVIALTYIYGIGEATAKKICADAGVSRYSFKGFNSRRSRKASC